MNAILLGFAERLEALEATKGLVEIEVGFETGATVTPLVAPFAGGLVRTSCPFTPTGMVLLHLQRTMPAGQPVPTLQSDVKWHFASGPRQGEGALIIDFVTGLDANSRYALRMGVTRA